MEAASTTDATVKVDVYMPWYPKDYMASTALFSTEESGAYSLLLMQMWIEGGTLPLEHDRLARVAKVADPDAWAAIWRVISVKFMPAAGQPGRITQRRLGAELVKARALKVVASDRGREGAAGRWGKRKPKPQETPAAPPEAPAPVAVPAPEPAPAPMPEHMLGQCSSIALQSPITNHQDPDPERARAGPDAGAGPEPKTGTVHQLVLRARGQPSLCDFHVGGVNVGRPAVPPRLPGCDECRRIRAGQLAARARPRPPDTPQTAGEILSAGGWPPREPRKAPHRAPGPSSTERQSELFEDRRGS
jgi:uncharacterized protein YdaU (DUF1376 family)